MFDFLVISGIIQLVILFVFYAKVSSINKNLIKSNYMIKKIIDDKKIELTEDDYKWLNW